MRVVLKYFLVLNSAGRNVRVATPRRTRRNFAPGELVSRNLVPLSSTQTGPPHLLVRSASPGCICVSVFSSWMLDVERRDLLHRFIAGWIVSPGGCHTFGLMNTAMLPEGIEPCALPHYFNAHDQGNGRTLSFRVGAGL